MEFLEDYETPEYEFTVHGPFNTFAAAKQWADERESYHGGMMGCRVMPLNVVRVPICSR